MVSQAQQAELVTLFLEEEVCVAIKGLNTEGAPGLDPPSVFSTLSSRNWLGSGAL